MDRLRSLKSHFEEPDPAVTRGNRSKTVSLYLKFPKRGISYSKGEMRLGIAIQAFLTVYIGFLLIAKGPEYSVANLIGSWYLLLTNLLALLPKLQLYSLLTSLNPGDKIQSLRQQMKRIFEMRVYRFNLKMTSLSLVNYCLLLAVSVFLWRYERSVPDLFLYSLAFLLRYFYSLYRYNKYFISNDKESNPFELPQLVHGNRALEALPKLGINNTCTICLREFAEGEALIDFPCENSHFFHTECIDRWMKMSLSCPLCKTEIFST